MPVAGHEATNPVADSRRLGVVLERESMENLVKARSMASPPCRNAATDDIPLRPYSVFGSLLDDFMPLYGWLCLPCISLASDARVDNVP